MPDLFILTKTAAQWTASNDILLPNQLGVESDIRNNTQYGSMKAKLGDGITHWNDLSYWNPDGVVGTGDVTGPAGATSGNLAVFDGATGKLIKDGGAPATGTVTSVSVTTANGVSGSVATATTTPAITLTLGAITPTTVNGLTISTSTGTLTVTNGKTVVFSNGITFAGTDSTTMTFPTTSATIARTDAANTFTGTQTIGALVATTVNGNTFTTGTGTLTIAASKTLTASNSITLAGTDSTTMTFPPASANIGYLESPINSQSVDYTAVLADSGKTLLQTGASKTFTIPANGSVAYPVGTCLSFICTNASGCSIAITTDTMTLANSTTTGTRTLAQNGRATAQKMTSTTWLISGAGLT